MPEKPDRLYKGNETKNRGQGPPDVNRRAWEVVQQAIGEMPKPEPPEEKDPRAVTMGKLIGASGGKKRAANLTPERRKEIAKKAAESRWGQKDQSA